jgi:hypothetical protein
MQLQLFSECKLLKKYVFINHWYKNVWNKIWFHMGINIFQLIVLRSLGNMNRTELYEEYGHSFSVSFIYKTTEHVPV